MERDDSPPPQVPSALSPHSCKDFRPVPHSAQTVCGCFRRLVLSWKGSRMYGPLLCLKYSLAGTSQYALKLQKDKLQSDDFGHIV